MTLRKCKAAGLVILDIAKSIAIYTLHKERM
jgi:hypothetical protein